jgi:DNA processing protein
MRTLTIDPLAPNYPRGMRLLRDRRRPRSPPAPLYLRGALPSLPGIAVVGTREASRAALAYTGTLVSALAGAGIAIWSGGAKGIDGAAHRAALAAGAPTVAVLAGGLDTKPCPANHGPLFRDIVERGGALLSPHADGSPRPLWTFHARNEVLVASTLATVVVEAREGRSGAGHSAAVALALGKPLFVVPAAPWSDTGSGCIELLRRGGQPIHDADDVLHSLDLVPGSQQSLLPGGSPARASHAPVPPQRAPPPPPQSLGDDEQALLGAIGDDPLHCDALCARTGLSAVAAQRALLTLTLHAMVVQDPVGYFRRAP